MSWKTPATAKLTGLLWFVLRALPLLDGIILAAGSAYFLWRFTEHSLDYLDATIFSGPWAQ